MAEFGDFGFGQQEEPFKLKRRRRTTEMTQSQQESLAKKIGRTALSGLAVVGNTLDVPGSMVRDTLAGANPFDQLLSPFTDENRTSGRELARQYGLAGPEDNWGNAIGGFAAEVALDPLTYLTLGGSTAATGIAKAAGLADDAVRAAKAAGKATGPLKGKMSSTLMDALKYSQDPYKAAKMAEAVKASGKSLRDVIDEPIGALADIGLPFTNMRVPLGTGPTAQAIAGGLDKIGNVAGKTLPVRAVRALFDSEVMGRIKPAEQALAKEVYGRRWDAHSESMAKVFEARDVYDEAKGAFETTFGAQFHGPGGADMDGMFDELVRFASERSPDEAMYKIAGIQGVSADPSLTKAVDAMRTMRDTIYDTLDEKGGRTPRIEGTDLYKQAPRYVDAKLAVDAKGRRISPTMSAPQRHREDAIRTVPADVVNKIGDDVAARGKFGELHIFQNYTDYLDPTFGGAKLPGEGQLNHATALKEWAEARGKGPVFTRQFLEDNADYLKKTHLVDKSLDAIHETFRNAIDPAGVPVETAYNSIGMDGKKAVDYLAKLLNQSPSAVKSMRIDREVVEAAGKHLEILGNPEWQNMLTRGIDKITGIYKRYLTVPFPAFGARNFSSGQFMNLASGHIRTFKDVQAYTESAREAARIGFSRDGVYRGKPSQANRDLYREMIIHGAIDPQTLFEGVEKTSKFAVPGNPFSLQTVREASQTVAAAPTRADAIPGMRGVRTAVESAALGGEKASATIEYLNRAPMYLYLKRKGYAPAEAAKLVRELQVDYSDLAPFEKQVMKRVMPFYAYQRRIAPVIIKTLATRPGGAMAQSLRAVTTGSSADASTPEHVASTSSIPLTGALASADPSNKRYLTGLGLPFEQPLQYLDNLSGRSALREIGSQLNPMLKAPIEWATNQSLFQTGPGGAGRALDDLDPALGRTLANIGEITGMRRPGGPAVKTNRTIEFLLSNSPASRVFTTARQLTDPRKGAGAKALSALTGLRIADVSPAARDATLRQKAAALMKEMGAREFTRTYFSEEQKAEMPPLLRKTANELDRLQRQLAIDAKRRKAQRQGAQASR